ncbi:hypothetical protein Bca4012_102140 [Brassica carinata]|uniref:Uncharacterized protein n=6 Tax=Brassica TaxID=3705 RepID=A0ABQ7Z795_BRANA|nr:PREDICTED: uncharacterized protein LOC106298171 [Brassica oleracea var. oleracea]KAF3519419.1 hypothetical protein DY000_02064145 [Brassica cretica]KAG2254548.1 hypothetical protein Bca52824_084684 [Brassica carinata]KAH0876094.1 hypothetical protein HID58_073456 [Brassica napus]VDD64699.1 unnamed protein product [Brassica oleracea]
MGSLGEEDLEKLVLDYIESSIIVPDHMEKSSTALVTLQEILETKGEKEKKMEDKVKSFIRRRKLSYEGDDEKRDVMKRIVSKLRSDGYNASIYGTSWDSSFDRRKGCSRMFRCTRKYEYIEVMVASEQDGDDGSKERLIIDLDFKSQFELVKQTESYKDVTQMLPTVFVATEERLKRVVSLICGEMKESMKKEGMSRPPWRTTRYMLAKWLPENRLTVSGSKKGSWSMFDDGEGGEAVKTTSAIGLKTTCGQSERVLKSQTKKEREGR